MMSSVGKPGKLFPLARDQIKIFFLISGKRKELWRKRNTENRLEK
jgi:hypothetical protein